MLLSVLDKDDEGVYIEYLDEAFLVEKCLEQVDGELEKFMLWIEKKESNQRIGVINN